MAKPITKKRPPEPEKSVLPYKKWLAIGIIFIFILIQIWPRQGIAVKLQAVGQNPWSIKKRLALSQELYHLGQLELAQKELAFIESNWLMSWQFKLRPQLKKSYQQTKNLIETPQRLKAEVDYWEKVLEEKPGYRDGLLRLAVLYYQTYQIDKAQTAWQKADKLDPNNNKVKEVGQLINQTAD